MASRALFPSDAMTDAPPRSVLLVDDSIVARAVLKRIIEADGRYKVAGAVGDAASAITFLLRTRVEIVLLDIEMPGQSGLAALPAILDAGEGARVLIVSSTCASGAQATVQALAQGAADTLVKPGTSDLAGAFARELRDRLDRLSHVADGPRSVKSVAPLPGRRDPPAIVAIGASTGGIHALGRMLGEIDAACASPILVTQHLPATFMPYFAAQLAVLARRPCEVVEDRTRLRPGFIHVAPGDAHLVCRPMVGGHVLRLSREPAASGCMPSVDPMLASVAACFGPSAMGIILSGMGRDGSCGARELVAAGGELLAQDRESSVVWGMPGVVASEGLADAVLSPELIGRTIQQRFPIRATH